MADEKKTTTKSAATAGDGAPLLELPSKPTPSNALADAEERSRPVTHPDSPVVGADAYNHAVTAEPVLPENKR